MTRSIRVNSGYVVPAIVLPFLGLLAPISAVAGDDDWQVDATLYVWGAGIDGTTKTGGDIDISFGDLWDNLDMAFMGAFEARKGKWGLLGDFVYMKVSADDSATEEVPVLGPITIPVKVNADVSMKNRIASFAGTYRVVDSGRVTLSLLGGVRYFALDFDMTLKLGVLNTSRSARISESDSVWDGVVGIRGEVQLQDRWYFPYHLDIGTGDSDATWQAIVGVGYKFDWGDLVFAYRHLDYDFKSGFPLRDTSIGGPGLGARFFF